MLFRSIIFKLLTPWLDRFLKGNLAAGPVYATQLATLASQNSITFFNPCASLPLPAEITRFNLFKSGQQTDITWTTGVEENVAFFTVEKSLDGVTFTTIDRQSPKGTGSRYWSSDKQPVAGVNYYRLAVTDVDGYVQYHPIQSIYFQTDKYFILAPNPSHGVIRLNMEKGHEFPVQLRVYNMAGVAVPVAISANQSDDYTFTFPDDAPGGMYFCYWFSENGMEGCGRVLLQR